MNTITKTFGILGVLFLTCISCTDDELTNDINIQDENIQNHELQIPGDSIPTPSVDPHKTRD